MDTPTTLMQAVTYFAAPEIAEAYMREMRWGSKPPTCPHCGSDRIGEIKTRNLMRCRDCRKQFSSRYGTIFEDSPLGLNKWFVAVWSVANCKNGISSHELGRALGVRQATAWFMLHRIRVAMECGDGDKFTGVTEMDTTYVGGKADNMHAMRRANVIRGRGAVGKTPVHGILQRGTDDEPSQIRAAVVGAAPEDTARHVLCNVSRSTTVYTDETNVYDAVARNYAHQAINHSVAYVAGAVHTNGVENFWTLLKRGIKGTYVSVAPFHLFRYVAEQVFRFNARKLSDGGRFRVLLGHVFGRRLTYRLLVGIDGAGFMGIE